MKREFQTTMEIDEETLSNLISTARSDVCGCAWWDYDEADYAKAKAALLAEGVDPDFETVLARMLLEGKKLRLLDPESDWHWSGHEKGELLWNAQIVAEGAEPVGGEWHEIGIEDIVRGIQQYGKSHGGNDCGADLEKIVEDGDFWDADAVIQYAMYGDWIYG